MLSVDTLQVFAWILFVYILRMKIWSKNKVFEFLGNHSLEFYLMQALPLRAFSILFGWSDKGFRAKEGLELSGYKDQLMALLYLALVLAATALLSVIVKFLTKKICAIFPSGKSSKGL